MWRRRRDHPSQSHRGTVTAAGTDTAQGLASRGRRGSRWRDRWNAWRVDRAHASQVAWADEPELTPVPGASDHAYACHFPLERWPMGEDEIRRTPSLAASVD